MPNTKKYVSLAKLATFLDNLKVLFATKDEVATKADAVHAHEITDVNNLQTTLDNLQSSINTGTSAAGTELGTVKSGGSVTIADGIITVNDDSHNHVIANVDGLQDALDAKSDATHNHDDVYYTEAEIDTKVSEINTTIEKIVDGSTVIENATHAVSADSATQDSAGNVIVDTYETKADATSKLTEAKAYADGIKNDLLNGAGEAYDTLKELGDLIVDNADAIDALETIATGKADAVHTHVIADVESLQDVLDAKAEVTHDHNDVYYTKTEVDNMEFITVDDIDAICGQTIVKADEVTF